jgi:hypothetical protein
MTRGEGLAVTKEGIKCQEGSISDFMFLSLPVESHQGLLPCTDASAGPQLDESHKSRPTDNDGCVFTQD